MIFLIIFWYIVWVLTILVFFKIFICSENVNVGENLGLFFRIVDIKTRDQSILFVLKDSSVNLTKKLVTVFVKWQPSPHKIDRIFKINVIYREFYFSQLQWQQSSCMNAQLLLKKGIKLYVIIVALDRFINNCKW